MCIRDRNEDRRLEQQQKLFDMKFKILEEELVKLATEKEHVKKQKAFYQRVSDFSVTAEQPVIRGEMFFSGVAVSYTHLDVYKRQDMSVPTLSNWIFLLIRRWWTPYPLLYSKTVHTTEAVKCVSV